MLGRRPSDDLVAQARAEQVARAAAVKAENDSLWRLERDIHDGPQQQLLRLQLDLATLQQRIDAVRGVHEGGTVLDPEVVAALLASKQDPLATLTPREREVLEQMAQGASNSQIAESLYVSLGTVEKNISAVFSKLGLEDSSKHNRGVQAVLAFVDVGCSR